MIKNAIKNHYHLCVLGLITLLVATYSPLNPLFEKAITTDQAVFFTIAEGLLDGKLAYVDFFDHKGPLLYMILALGLVFPGEMIGNFMIEIGVIFVSALFLYKIANLFAARWISLLSVLIIFCSDITLYTTANSEEYIFPLICISTYLFLLQLKNGIDRRQVLIIGFCGMLVFFLKFNYCLIWASLGILLFIWMLLQKKHKLDIVKMCVAFFAGMILAVVPFAIYLFATGSFDEFLEVYVLYSLNYAEFTGIDARINCIKFLLDTPISIFFYISLFVLLLYLIYRSVTKKESFLEMRQEQFVLAIYFCVFSLAVLGVTASPGQSWYYYKQGAIIIFIVPIALVMNMLFELLSIKLNKVICAVIVVIAFVASIHTRLTPSWYKITTDYRFASAMTICDIINQNCTEDDNMISFTNDCTMYFYSDCEPASRIFFPSAAVVNEGLFDELMSDLNRNKPKIITMQSDWKAGLSERMQEETRAFISASYILIYEDEFRTVYLRD